MIWTTILTYASKKMLPFIIKNWWKIAIAILVLVVIWKVNGYLEDYKDMVKKSNELMMENRDINRTLAEQNAVMLKWMKSVEISQQSVQADTISEKHYHESVTKNESVINNYIEQGETKEGLQELYIFLNDKWSSVDLPYETTKQGEEK